MKRSVGDVFFFVLRLVEFSIWYLPTPGFSGILNKSGLFCFEKLVPPPVLAIVLDY